MALVGPEPWLILSTEDYPGTDCVAVGVHQDLQIWNKGTESVTVEWLGANVAIGSDDKHETGPVGEVLDPGTNVLEASPYEAPILHVVDPDDSASAQTEMTLTGFGGIQLGMTVAEAADSFGHPITVDPDLAPGPECWQAVVAGDPYSPILTVEGEGNADSVVIAITTFYPPDAELTISDPRAAAALCP
ncbi:MAG TPA: hypothetical protein VLS86_09305 [Acidimicrobiia bacterium]|nr:hypothetical protein [Acidimicrobiia bacterium]